MNDLDELAEWMDSLPPLEEMRRESAKIERDLQQKLGIKPTAALLFQAPFFDDEPKRPLKNGEL